VRAHLSMRGAPWRSPQIDPKCVRVTHWRRAGKNARFEFRCYLSSTTAPSPRPAPFWLPYLDLLTLVDGKTLLESSNWRMPEYLDWYSDGEEVWDSGGDSHDEELRGRRLARGRPHELTLPTAAARRCSEKKRSRAEC
jgi:hypothetical protein